MNDVSSQHEKYTFHGRPKRIGFHASSYYIPEKYIDLRKLELKDNVPGKYAIGLGQERMAIPGLNEDALKMAIEALKILEKKMKMIGIDLTSVGRLEVGSESNPDRSKSIKSGLMQFLEDQVDGCDHVAACYGGTSSIFCIVNWIESSEWDGRFGIAVMTDIASYNPSDKSAFATGGAGAVAILIGPYAPLYIDANIFGTYSTNVNDFRRPLNSQWPVLDGKLSISTYLKALESCVAQYKKRNGGICDAIVFHCPFSKMAQKAFDVARNLGIIEKSFQDGCLPSLQLVKKIGNIYCGSVYLCLFTILKINLPIGARIGIFSYGSSCSSKFYTVIFEGNVNHLIADSGLVDRQTELLTDCSWCSQV